MKIKLENTLFAVFSTILTIAIILSTIALLRARCLSCSKNKVSTPILEAGDFVEHKLHGWHGFVLKNQDGETITVRYAAAHEAYISSDMFDVEWEKE